MSVPANVVLVHGLWLHGSAMLILARRVGRCGYRASTYSYPTVRVGLTENAARLARHCEGLPAGQVHFVAHSMGGAVALTAAGALAPARRGRIVLLGTPFVDTYSGRRLKEWPGGGAILGRCMAEWLDDPRSARRNVGVNPFDACDVGVIAGTGRVGLGRLFAPALPQPNDGVVSVEETRVPGMRDHVVLPVSHTAMLVSREVARQTCAFLSDGKFDRSRLPAASVN